MDKYPKTDSEFEALFELVYKKKIDASQFNGLQKKAIYDRMRSKSHGAGIRSKGIENALAMPSIKTRLYLGKTAGGKKIYFTAEFSKKEINCSSTIDLREVAKQLDSFDFDQSGGRARNFAGKFPTRRKGSSNFTKMTIAWLLAFQHICTFKQVGHVGSVPSKELTRELMYLVMAEVEGVNENSPYYGVMWSTVIEAWKLPAANDFHRYKSYFNSLVNTELKEMEKSSVQQLKREEKAS